MNLMATERLFGIRYNLICASSGEEALGKIREKKPDLVLLDLHMPKMDGLEALTKILESDADAKVIMITAAGQQDKKSDDAE